MEQGLVDSGQPRSEDKGLGDENARGGFKAGATKGTPPELASFEEGSSSSQPRPTQNGGELQNFRARFEGAGIGMVDVGSLCAGWCSILCNAPREAVLRLYVATGVTMVKGCMFCFDNSGLLSKVGMTLSEVESATELNWSHKQLNDADVAVLSRILETHTKLRTLKLWGNMVGDIGATALASALEKNDSLETLYLGSNRVGDAGASALAASLETNTTLYTLNIGNNCIGNMGASALNSALEHNDTLQELILYDDHPSFSTALMQTINAKLQRRSSEREQEPLSAKGRDSTKHKGSPMRYFSGLSSRRSAAEKAGR